MAEDASRAPADRPAIMMPRSDVALVLKAGAIALVCLAVAPFMLDTYSTNILIRALLLGVLALTVDILWGYTGVLTFGQSAFFGIGAYACALVFKHLGFGPGWAVGALLLGIVAAMAVSSSQPGATSTLARNLPLICTTKVI